MKSSHTPNPKPRRLTPAEVDALGRRDRIRIIVMSAAVVLLAGGYFVSRAVQSRYQDAADAELPVTEAPPEAEAPPVVVQFDMPEALEAIRDETPEQRTVIRDHASLTKVFDYGRLFSERQYRALGVRELDAELLAELEANPGAHRVEAFRARGVVLRIERRKREQGYVEETHATLALEGERGYAHLIVAEGPKGGLQVGDWARADGVFFQLFRPEIAGEWRDGPLLLGRELVRSYAPPEVARIEDVRGLSELGDDTLESTTPVPDEVVWDLMALAASGSDIVDWDAAPELDAELLNAIFQDGTEYRGKPFRLPVSRNVGSWTEVVGENPLRLERRTTGWIGNFSWKGAVGAIQYVLAEDRPELQEWRDSARYVFGRGFFVKNVNYEQQNRKPGRVPFFVLESLEVFTPDKDSLTTKIMWGVLAGTVLLIGVFWRLLALDKKRARQLHDELVRRRRARRERVGVGQAVPDAEA